MSIKISSTNKNISSCAGLITLKKLFNATSLQKILENAMPQQSYGSDKNYKKFTDLTLGLIAGADCLDDMQKLSNDQGFLALCDEKVYTPKTYADFLRSFSKINIHSLQEALLNLSFNLRSSLFPNDPQFFFDIDSTPNQQHGEKMEGVAKNYQHIDCVDSLCVFDDKGFEYFIDVRPGNTHTANNAEVVIHRLMSLWNEKKSKSNLPWHVCLRMDRGFYNSDVINAVVAKNADLIIGVRQDEYHFPRIINQIHNWTPTNLEDSECLKFYDGREVEIGTTHYRHVNCTRRLRYIVMRAKKQDNAPLFKDHPANYDYFAFATTYSEQLMSDEEVIFCYRKRGQAENYIKENKYGLDMKHYPCQKLDANRAYALICAFAYNYMRLMALAANPKKAVLAKNIRFRWINLPCLVARTGRQRILKFMKHHYREIQRWCELIHNLQFGFA